MSPSNFPAIATSSDGWRPSSPIARLIVEFPPSERFHLVQSDAFDREENAQNQDADIGSRWRAPCDTASATPFARRDGMRDASFPRRALLAARDLIGSKPEPC